MDAVYFCPRRSFHSIQHIETERDSSTVCCSSAATLYIDFYQYKASTTYKHCIWCKLLLAVQLCDTVLLIRARAVCFCVFLCACARFCCSMCSISLLWALSSICSLSPVFYFFRPIYNMRPNTEQFSSRAVEQQYYMTDGHKLFYRNVYVCLHAHTHTHQIKWGMKKNQLFRGEATILRWRAKYDTRKRKMDILWDIQDDKETNMSNILAYALQTQKHTRQLGIRVRHKTKHVEGRRNRENLVDFSPMTNVLTDFGNRQRWKMVNLCSKRARKREKGQSQRVWSVAERVVWMGKSRWYEAVNCAIDCCGVFCQEKPNIK